MRAGKRLAKRETTIAIQFKRAPHPPFEDSGGEGLRPNVLLIHVQPDEGVSLAIGAKVPGAGMQIAPDQGALMNLLVKMIGAKRIVEVGCFTGYSAICMAAALPEAGKLITLDIDPETTAVAKRYFASSGLGSKIELRLGPALTSLAKLETEFGSGSFDLMFIDADKGNMPQYYEMGLKLVRQGGLILADNVLWGGSVVDPHSKRPDTDVIQKFNAKLKADERVDRMLLNISDGLYIARKR